MSNKQKSGSHNKHARYSASGAFRWVWCTGSIFLTEKLIREGKIPRYTTSEAADRGTQLHDFADWILHQELFSSTKSKPTLDKVTDEETLHIEETYVANCIELAKQCSRVFIETEATLFYGRQGETGTLDFAAIKTNDEGKITRLYVRDLKAGQGRYTYDVTSYRNFQMAIYAMSLIEQLAFEEGLTFSDDCVVDMMIDKPFVDVDDKPWELTLIELQEFLEEVVKAAEDIENNIVRFAPSAKVCMFCPAYDHCFARHTEPVKPFIVPQDIEVLTDEQKLKIYNALPLFKKLAKDIEDYFNEFLDRNGNPTKPLPDGLEIKRGGVRRCYPQSGSEAHNELVGLLESELGAAAFEPRQLIAMTNAEKQLKGAKKKRFKKLLTSYQLPAKMVPSKPDTPEAERFSALNDVFNMD
jgi:hypothetical protein